jgi:hypothetical protein
MTPIFGILAEKGLLRDISMATDSHEVASYEETVTDDMLS